MWYEYRINEGTCDKKWGNNEKQAIKYKVIYISINSSLLENQNIPMSITFISYEKIHGKEGSGPRPYFSAWQATINHLQNHYHYT